MKDLHWFEPGKELSLEELANAQVQLDVYFPTEYCDLVLKHDGGSNPDECSFEYVLGERTRVGNFGMLLSLRKTSSENVFETIENLAEQLPLGVIPVVDTGSGDFVCFDYRAGQPAVVYFAHERVDDKAIIPLAASFREFLDSLREPVDE